MKRRKFLKKAAAGAVVTGTAVAGVALVGCEKKQEMKAETEKREEQRDAKPSPQEKPSQAFATA